MIGTPTALSVGDSFWTGRQALDAAGHDYRAWIYAGANHGFHNDTTPRYDKDAAELAWRRTIEFFRRNLV